MTRTIANFSAKKTVLIFLFSILFLVWIWTRPTLSHAPLLAFISSGRWEWMWPIAAAASAWLAFGISLALLRVAFFKGSAIYVEKGYIINVFPFIMKIGVADCTSAALAPSTTKVLQNSNIIRIYLRNGQYKSIRAALFDESPQITVDKLNDVIHGPQL